MNAVMSFVGLCLLLGVGHWLRSNVRLLQKLYLPSCVIGGLVGLIVLQGFAWPLRSMGEAAPGWLVWVNEALPAWTTGWGKLPGFLINVVFACLLLALRCRACGPSGGAAGRNSPTGRSSPGGSMSSGSACSWC